MTENTSHADNWAISYNKIVGLYHDETDRAAAVLAASFLEKQLEDCLKLFLVDDRSIEELFNGYGPLSSFSAKISIAFALGLISDDMKRDLTLMRKIRNHFAHHPSEISFGTSPARDLCANLSMAQPIRHENGEIFHEPNPRLQFLFTVGAITIRMYQIVSKQQKRVSPVFGIFAQDDNIQPKQ